MRDVRGRFAGFPRERLAAVTAGPRETVLQGEVAALRSLVRCHAQEATCMNLARVVRRLSHACRSEEQEDARQNARKTHRCRVRRLGEARKSWVSRSLEIGQKWLSFKPEGDGGLASRR